MRFLVDAQLPPVLARFLREQGHEAGHVITKDEVFVLLAAWKESAPRIVWIRVRNCSNRGLLEWFKPLLPSVVDRIEAGDRVIEIV